MTYVSSKVLPTSLSSQRSFSPERMRNIQVFKEEDCVILFLNELKNNNKITELLFEKLINPVELNLLIKKL